MVPESASRKKTQTLTSLWRNEEGEQDDKHLNDTRYEKIVDIVERFTSQINSELDQRVIVRTARPLD